ncbi:hypothetical protein HDU79_000924, partial [Rhizoclosmatium sp. JEL0117]
FLNNAILHNTDSMASVINLNSIEAKTLDKSFKLWKQLGAGKASKTKVLACGCQSSVPMCGNWGCYGNKFHFWGHGQYLYSPVWWGGCGNSDYFKCGAKPSECGSHSASAGVKRVSAQGSSGGSGEDCSDCGHDGGGSGAGNCGD